MSQNILSRAMDYVERNSWSVIPLRPKSKVPVLGQWAAYQESLPTLEELRRWFADGTQYNLAIVTGKVSNLVVVDLDGREGLAEAARHGLTSSVSVSTGRGKHLYFKMPKEGLSNAVKAFPGIDLRGEGGYCVAPPSVHELGRCYTWLNYNPMLLPELPTWLIKLSTKDVSSNTPGWIGETLASLRPGFRDDPITSIVGRLHRDGWTAGDIKALLSPHPEVRAHGLNELDRIVSSVTRYSAPKIGKALSIKDIMATPPITDWVVKDLIPAKTITFLAGLQGVGKTWLAIDFSMDQASSSAEWLGRFPVGNKRVMYIDEEGQEGLWRDRLLTLLPSKPNFVDSSLAVFVRNDFNFSTPEGLMKFENMVKQNKSEVIIIDSLSCVHDKSEQDTKEVMALMATFKRLVRELGVSFFILDHEGRGVYEKEKQGIQPNAGDLAGNLAKARQADQVFIIRKRGDGLVFYQTKARYTEELQPFLIQRHEEAGVVRYKAV